VPRLASFLDEDLAAAWAQVATWGQTHELVSRHLDVLRQTRDALAGAWPPERSPAAAKFFSVLDQLIASMDEMQGVAVTNGATLQGILKSLDETTHVVGGLHRQWTEMVTVEGKPGFRDPGWRTKLNEQARAQMSATDQAAVEYYAYLTVPTAYQPPSAIDEPPSPPPTGGSDAQVSVQGGTQPGPRPPAISPVTPLPEPDPSGVGPVLTGSPGGAFGNGQPSPGTPGGTPPPPVGTVPAAPTKSWSVVTPSGRVMRAGGVIGPTVEPDISVTSPAVGRSGSVGGSIPEETASHGINPVGGLLGGPMGVGPHDRRQARDFAPRIEWEVRKGGAPVLLPPPEPAEHDPGPGVIGIDR
jgi:hypothetical protein